MKQITAASLEKIKLNLMAWSLLMRRFIISTVKAPLFSLD